MNKAIDPVSGKLLEVQEWLKVCSNRREGLCPVCDEEISLRADKSENTRTHFTHRKGSQCPTIEKNHKPFEHLVASDIDNENGEYIKSLTIANSYSIYEKCKGLADNLSVKEFRELIDFATSKGVWNFKGLTFMYVPYILLTCRERFIKKDSDYRKKDFYFVLDPNLNKVDELWNDTKSKKQKLWKINVDNNSVEEYSINEILVPEWFTYTKEYITNKLS
ncbi:hypothetical protein NSQ38_24070 [Paenibacillus sp. FSL R7-0313]|uniref:hypothetical protein n=1 Tax=Paenibacillus sp. FSL R7-0313 TaxID=2954532 RepID=UPI0030D7DA8D